MSTEIKDVEILIDEVSDVGEVFVKAMSDDGKVSGLKEWSQVLKESGQLLYVIIARGEKALDELEKMPTVDYEEFMSKGYDKIAKSIGKDFLTPKQQEAAVQGLRLQITAIQAQYAALKQYKILAGR